MMMASFLVELIGSTIAPWYYLHDSLLSALIAFGSGVAACTLARLYAVRLAPLSRAWYEQASLLEFARSGTPWIARSSPVVFIACIIALAIGGWYLSRLFGDRILTYVRQHYPFELNLAMPRDAGREWILQSYAPAVLGSVFGGMLGVLLAFASSA